MTALGRILFLLLAVIIYVCTYLIIIILFQVSDEPEVPEDGMNSTGLDDFTRKLTEDDARVLVDLLKLAVAGRAGPGSSEAITKVLIGNVKQNIFQFNNL